MVVSCRHKFKDSVASSSFSASSFGNGEGECGSFQWLFLTVLKSHGIIDAEPYLITPSINNPASSFIVNDWEFLGEQDVGDPDFTHINIPKVSENSALETYVFSRTQNSNGNNRYEWFYERVRDELGIDGQGSDPNTHDNP